MVNKAIRLQAYRKAGKNAPCLSTTRCCPGQSPMNSEGFSVIVTCWYDPQADATRIKVVRVDTTEKVRLSVGSFLLRISIDEGTSILRCFVRHIASGREAYVQGGPNLRAFIRACLLQDDTSEIGPAGPNTTPGR